MAASLATLLVLALHCCAPAAAARDDDGLTRAALAAGDTKVDSTDIDKEAEPKCVCILKKVEKAETRSYSDQQECIQECPQLCNSELRYKYDPPVEADKAHWRAEDAWWGNQYVLPNTHPTTASSCGNGKCKCLNMTGWKEKVDAFRSKNTEFDEIVDEWKGGSHNCMESCPEWCDETRQSYCLHKWDIPQFLAQDNKCEKWNERKPLGLVSCHYRQYFHLSKNTEESGKYTVELDLYLNDKSEPYDVVFFQAEGSINHETSVEVGFPGVNQKKWSVSTEAKKLYKWNWRWKVEEDGEKRFIIEETANKKAWEAKEVVSGKEIVRYYAKRNSTSEEVEFDFYSDSRKEVWVGVLFDDGTLLQVVKKEDAGLIVMTSVLIMKGLKGMFR